MIRNFIKIALRGMMRSKAYSFINIAGLSVGVACCLLLALYIQDELSYDKHHKDAENIYRVISYMGKDNQSHTMGTTSAPIVWGIKDEIPEFDQVTRLVNPPGVSQNLIRYETNQFYETNGFIADSTVFQIFTYQFLEGNPKTALREANSVVIQEKLARKLFGNEPALNKVIYINQGGPSGDYTVTGVIKDLGHSHIEANFFVSISSTGGWAPYLRSPDVVDEWAGQNFMLSYVKLKPNHNVEDVKAKMNAAFMKHAEEDLKALGFTKKLSLDPVKDIYLYAEYGEKSARATYLYVIASIAAFILLIACINFMNLSTARATKRANEVGLRKTLGAYRSSLIAQFLGEAMVIVLVAIAISAGIVQFALPGFNTITGKEISLESANFLFLTLALGGITILTGFLAGSYPAFYLSSFQPATVLKGKSVLQSSNSLLRRGLVVFQFVIAITLVCGMIIISKQLSYIQEKNLGFDATHKIVLPLRTGTAQTNFITLNNELSKLASVKSVSATNYLPGSAIWTDFNIYPEGGNMDRAIHFRNNWVEPNYIEFMGIGLIKGSHFPDEHPTNQPKTRVIINRQGVKELGLSVDDAVGQSLFFEWQGKKTEFEVIGVMENFHQTSLKEEIYPLLLRVPEKAEYDYAIVDMESSNLQATISECENIWKKINSDTPFEYSFLEENVQKQYEDDKRMSLVISSFTIIAMIISCLGLYGLSTYMAERRFKEIGIRKVMGASVQQIVSMMSGEFVKLVLIAFVIAVPLSLYAINKWLEGFAYKTTADFMVFVYAGTAALLIAVITISFESIRAAMENPVKALRNE